MSRADPPPASPSNDSSKNGSTVATFPASTLSRATASNAAEAAGRHHLRGRRGRHVVGVAAPATRRPG